MADCRLPIADTDDRQVARNSTVIQAVMQAVKQKASTAARVFGRCPTRWRDGRGPSARAS
jgi:hypothetical protein